MSYGLSEHVIIGHVGSIRESRAGEHLVINISLGVTPRFREQEKGRTTWYEAGLWDRQAENFKKLDFKVGDRLFLRLDNLKAEIFKGQDDKIRVTLKGTVEKFLDLRQSALPRDGEEVPERMANVPRN